MRNSSALFLIAIFLASCATTPAATPTLTQQPAETATLPDTSDGTETPTMEDTIDIEGILHDICYYGTEEINSYEEIVIKNIEINGENYEAMVGKVGEEETILAAKMTTYTNEKVWTRISITDLGGDNGQMVIWLNPDQDGAIQVNEKTAELFMSRFLEVVRDGGQGASIDNMTEGDITLEVPYAKYEQGGPDIKWVEETLDLNNIEMRFIQSPEEWQEFLETNPEMAAKVFSSSYGRSGAGVCLFPKDIGGMLLVVFQPSLESRWDGTRTFEENELRESLDELFYRSFWVPLSTFAFYEEGEQAFSEAFFTGRGEEEYPYLSVKRSFDIMPQGFMESLPQK